MSVELYSYLNENSIGVYGGCTSSENTRYALALFRVHDGQPQDGGWIWSLRTGRRLRHLMQEYVSGYF
jgi:hypothetical protein